MSKKNLRTEFGGGNSVLLRLKIDYLKYNMNMTTGIWHEIHNIHQFYNDTVIGRLSRQVQDRSLIQCK